jgi:hypothetical protein
VELTNVMCVRNVGEVVKGWKRYLNGESLYIDGRGMNMIRICQMGSLGEQFGVFS